MRSCESQEQHGDQDMLLVVIECCIQRRVSRTSVQVLQVPSCPGVLQIIVGDDTAVTAFFWRGPDHPRDRQSATVLVL
jgi:hypothetical protein